MNDVVRHLRRAALLSAGDGPTDARLLEAFLARRDEAAFEALLRRHGPMVWGVCRRVLGEHDAEDAFQATFLVLARKAASVRPRERVGNWLYGVAHRTATNAQVMNAKRRARERQAGCDRCARARTEEAQDELLAHLDVELSRLPDRYREPVVLCDLEGRGRREVARQLDIPEGTLSSRLATARKMLAQRLARHGTVLSGATLATLLAAKEASAGLPRALLVCTGKAATRVAAGEALVAGTVPAFVITLTEGVMKAMLLSKLKTLGAVVLALCVGIGAVGLSSRPAQAGPRQPVRATPDDLEALRLELEALRKDVQAMRERMKTLEAQVKSQGQGTKTAPGTAGVKGGTDADPRATAKQALEKLAGDAVKKKLIEKGLPNPKESQKQGAPAPKGTNSLQTLEKALEAIRANPGDKHAHEVLAEALRALKEQKKGTKGGPEQ